MRPSVPSGHPPTEPVRLEASVVVPSYRRPSALLACLNGLVTQSRPPDEIVVVLRDEDVESRERLAAWLSGHADAAQAFKLALVSRPGQLPALNAGLAAATGEVVAFLDDDCVPQPQWLDRLLVHYADPCVGGVGGRDVVHCGNSTVEGQVSVVGKYQWFGRPIGNHHLQYAPGRPVAVDLLKGANMSFRRDLLEGFDEVLQLGAAQCNDLDASLSVRRRGFLLIYDPHVVVDHYPSERYGEATRSYDVPHMLFAEGHNWMYVVLKHASWWQVPVLLGYGFLVGHTRAYGLLRAAAGCLQVGPAMTAWRLRWSLQGKLAGALRWARSLVGEAH